MWIGEAWAIKPKQTGAISLEFRIEKGRCMFASALYAFKPLYFYGLHGRNARTMNIFGVGLPEMGLIMIVALLVFGPKKLPEISRSLGGAIRRFAKGV